MSKSGGAIAPPAPTGLYDVILPIKHRLLCPALGSHNLFCLFFGFGRRGRHGSHLKKCSGSVFIVLSICWNLRIPKYYLHIQKTVERCFLPGTISNHVSFHFIQLPGGLFSPCNIRKKLFQPIFFKFVHSSFISSTAPWWTI